MGITVREAMQVQGLDRCHIVAGASGTDREVDYITVMEVPDVIRWLKSKAFLLTSLYAIKDDSSALEHLIKQLDDSGCAGIAIKTRRFFDEIPASIIQAANALNLPVIEIDPEIPYVDIMLPLMSTILSRTSMPIDDVEGIFQWVTELAMEGQSARAILRVVENWMGNLLTLESTIRLADEIEDGKEGMSISPLTQSQRAALAKSKRSLRMTRILNHQDFPCFVTPLILDGQLQACLSCWGINRALRESDLAVMERLVPLISFEILKVKTKIDVEQTYKDDFLFELLLGQMPSEEEICRREELYGWDLSLHFVVLAIDASLFGVNWYARGGSEPSMPEVRGSLVRLVDRAVRSQTRHAVVGSRADKIVVLYPVDMNDFHLQRNGEWVKGVVQKVRSRCIRELPEASFSVGISRPYSGLQGVRIGYREALKAIQFGKSANGVNNGENCTVYYPELGIYRLLNESSNREDLQLFYQDTIAKLVQYDQSRGTNLVQSLRMYFSHNGNLVAAAASLFIHVNSLKYRLKRAEEITHCELGDADGRLQLHIGLKILDLLEGQSD